MPATGPAIPVVRSSTTTPSSTPVMPALPSCRHRRSVDVGVRELPPAHHEIIAEVQEHDVVVLVARLGAADLVVAADLDDDEVGIHGGEVVDHHVGDLVEALLH